MKYILIYVAMNFSNADDPSLLAHKIYNSRAECLEVLAKLPKAEGNLKSAGFCISEGDLMEIKINKA